MHIQLSVWYYMDNCLHFLFHCFAASYFIYNIYFFIIAQLQCHCNNMQVKLAEIFIYQTFSNYNFFISYIMAHFLTIISRCSSTCVTFDCLFGVLQRSTGINRLELLLHSFEGERTAANNGAFSTWLDNSDAFSFCILLGSAQLSIGDQE